MSPTITSLANAFLARAQAQGWRGKVADDRAVEFFLGAWCGAQLLAPKSPATESLGIFTSMILPARGMKELKRIAQAATNE